MQCACRAPHGMKAWQTLNQAAALQATAFAF